ncbi:MAG: AAA family ATPase [Candidatus Diapherotrites archaeon]
MDLNRSPAVQNREKEMPNNLFRKELAKDTVFENRDYISPHYIPEELPFRENQIKEITKDLGAALKGQKPNNLFIYGKVGTGKTATTKHVLQHLEEFAIQQQQKVGVCYINCRQHNSKHKVFMKAVKQFFPKENWIGYSNAFIYEKVIDFAKEKRQVIFILDEIDKVKDLDDLVYALTRSNDELLEGSISLIGISNYVLFKDRLDARTKSALCEKELVFSPYNAEELKAILQQRVEKAFKPRTVQGSALNLAAAIAAQESGDARTAVLLLLRAGELADEKGKKIVSDEEVKQAKEKVEKDLVYSLIATLPEQQQLVLYTIALQTLKHRPLPKISGKEEVGALMSGEVFEEYEKTAKKLKESAVSARWFRSYVNELETYGLLNTTPSGPGQVGNTRLIRLSIDADKCKQVIEKEMGLN